MIRKFFRIYHLVQPTRFLALKSRKESPFCIMASFFHGLINCMTSTQTFTSLDCVRDEGVKLKKQQRIGDDLHHVSRGAIGSK